MPDALNLKYPQADKDWAWQWRLPAFQVSREPRSGGNGSSICLNRSYSGPSDNQSVLTILPGEKGYASEPELGWDRGAYIPANQKIAVSFRMTYDYSGSYPKTDRDDLNKLNVFLKHRLKEIEGFAILDKEHRYEIMFPKGWKEPKDPSESNKAGK